ncbi:aminoacyl-tRNA hydrolase [Thiomicrospira microaerophila]|uniref:aminoacyl-tRNA hydrolase n=1 Tax=Thiomicrospira microaerophila TaxID=406020 RepID=UPI00200FD7CA|nr:aminoacyl-tRNA hydrolase [Thiomicrospira microaerophila]UQB42769.1 aminoacyl-tRNA hydrolase [Thiomicrospira microaerophila]
MSSVQLIVGLGNPGEQYEQTRHNAGFWFVEEIARQYQAVFRPEAKFFGELAKIQVGQYQAWLLKPATFMNRSGQSIQALAKFYRLAPDQILVAHDELDLPVGVAKLKTGGGHGGHNGLRDTIAALGTPNFHRLRLGIDHPGDRHQVVNYVLKAPAKIERESIDEAIYQSARVLSEVLNGDWAKAMNQLHTKPVK